MNLTVARLDDPVVKDLIELIQGEYVVRYGGPDDAPIDAEQFAPPRGLFLLATLDGEPAGCGGWRDLGDGRAEIKRMFTVAAVRNRGVARAVLAELERTAAAAGIRDVVLETGAVQPEAIALYRSTGYDRIDGFGHYAGAPLSRAFGKRLAAQGTSHEYLAGAGDAQTPTGRVVVVADTTEVSDSSAALPDDA